MGVEAGERLVGIALPRRGQRLGQVVLLGQQIDGPVAHPARLDEQHLGRRRQDVGEQPLVVDEPRQPALHAVEQGALGEALPLLTAPRLHGDEPAGPLADVVGRDQLAGREDQRLGEVAGRALVVDAEARQAVDLVTPQVDAHRARRRSPGRRRRWRRDGRTRRGARRGPRGGSRTRRGGRRARRDRRRRRAGRRSARRSVAPGPRRCSRARTPVTTTAGQRSGSRRRHSTSRRRPIVSTDGLTRSNGSVSQAGNKATSPAGRNCSRSSASWAAIVPVGVATTSGRRLDSVARAAIEIGRATSTTASRASGSPRARVSAGSSRSSGGSAARRTGPSRLPIPLAGWPGYRSRA